MKELRTSALVIFASLVTACSTQVETGSGGSTGTGSSTATSSCTAATPGMCAPTTTCANGVMVTGQASCVNGNWVCETTPCDVDGGSPGCDGSLIPICADGMASSFCCPPGAPCAAPEAYCDLGGGKCAVEQPIFASQYDQSCAADADCVTVYEGNLCTDCACPNAAIKATELSAYQAAVTAAHPPPGLCDCAGPTPVCKAGVCSLP